jgi:hypothetical protein
MLLLITKTQGENTMNNIEKRRYEKAIDAVYTRTDLNNAQKEFYLQEIDKLKFDVMNHPKPDANYGSTISVSTTDGKVIRVGEGDTNHSSIDNRLWSVVIDWGLATPQLRDDETAFHYAKSGEYGYKVIELELDEYDIESRMYFRVKKEFVFTGWEMSDKVKSYRVKINN